MSKIKLNHFKFISIFIVVVISSLLVTYFYNSKAQKLCFQDTCFIVEIAQTDEARQQWLMFREKLETNRGMLFIFDESKFHSFWMKNTLIPLDMVRISENFQIVDIQTAEPCTADPCPSYVPAEAAKYVLEINADMISQKNIKIWDFAKFFLD